MGGDDLGRTWWGQYENDHKHTLTYMAHAEIRQIAEHNRLGNHPYFTYYINLIELRNQYANTTDPRDLTDLRQLVRKYEKETEESFKDLLDKLAPLVGDEP